VRYTTVVETAQAEAMMTSEVARPLDVVIAGAQKAGTTGLLRTLGTHPMVTTLSQQEATVFHQPAASWKAWCASYLDSAPKPDTLLVGKLATLMHFEDSVQRVRRYNPHVKLVVILRHPVDRILSLYRYAVGLGLESRPLEVALKDNRVERAREWRLRSYSGGSEYRTAIGILSRALPDAVVYVNYEELSSGATLRSVEEALGLTPGLSEPVRANESGASRSPLLARLITAGPAVALGRKLIPSQHRAKVRAGLEHVNRGALASTPQVLNDDTRRRLLERHAPDVEAASAVLGRDLPAWRV